MYFTVLMIRGVQKVHSSVIKKSVIFCLNN